MLFDSKRTLAVFKKKPKKDDLEAFRDITDDVLESEFVPYACHWNKNTIVTKNGEILQIIKITGLSRQDQGDDEEVNLRVKLREAISQCIDSTKYAIWIHTIRRRKDCKSKGDYKRDFAGYLNNFWNDKNNLENKFANEIYITLVKEGKDASFGDFNILLNGIFSRVLIKKFEKYLDQSVAEMSAITAKILPIISDYGAKLLTITKRGNRYFSEPCEFLSKLISLRENDFPVEEEDLSKALTDYDVTFGSNAMEVRMRSDGKRRYGAILTLREYRELDIGTLEVVLQIPSEMVITQSFEFISAKLAISGFKKQAEIFNISKVKDLSERIGLTDIITSEKGKATDFGRHQLNIFILADSVKILERDITVAVKALATLGMTPIREDVFLEECYWAQLPGNFEFVKRMRPINTRKIGGFANVNNFSTGQEQENHWGNSVTTLNTANKTSYFFNFHDGDNGHTALISLPDSGKTRILNFLLSESRKFDNQVFIFDVNRKSEIFIRALNGKYFNACTPRESRDYAKMHLNPFVLDDTTENRDFLCDWLSSLIPHSDTHDVKGICAKAVAGVMLQDNPKRNLKECVEIIRNESAELADMFHEWTGGSLSSIFADNDTLEFTNSIIGFEMGSIIETPSAIIPVTSYLLHRINLSLNGKPTIIVLNEAWKLLDNAFFVPTLPIWLDYLRHHNAMGLFATENANETMHSDLTKILMQKTATQLFLPDSDADDRYEKNFGLSDDDIAYLSVMNNEDCHFMIKHKGESIISELNLTGMNDIMKVLSANPGSLAVMEEIINKKGIVAANWMPSFLENI